MGSELRMQKDDSQQALGGCVCCHLSPINGRSHCRNKTQGSLPLSQATRQCHASGGVYNHRVGTGSQVRGGGGGGRKLRSPFTIDDVCLADETIKLPYIESDTDPVRSRLAGPHQRLKQRSFASPLPVASELVRPATWDL